MGNSEEQEEEIEVLESIYDESILSLNKNIKPWHGTLKIHPMLPDSFYIESDAIGNVKEAVKIQFLPPIILYFQFVDTYPLITGPAFVLTCQWLTHEQLSKLCENMDKLYNECKPEVVIFRWVNFLQEEALGFLEIEDNLDISRLVNFFSPPVEIAFLPALKKETSACSPKRSNVKSQKEDQKLYVSPQKRCTSKGAIKLPVNSASNTTNRRNSMERQQIKEKCNTKSEKVTEDLEKNLEIYRHDLKLKSGIVFHNPEIVNNSENPKLDSRAVVNLLYGSELLSKIIEYNEKKKQEVFEKDWFTCKVCLSDKQGCNGFRFQGCDHLYCKDCMNAYFCVQINEGNVQCLTCPDEKCSSQALPHQIHNLVGEEMFTRYDKILLEATLSTMTDITTCPRTTCQCFIMLEPGATIASCTACRYHFCIFCHKTYHGLEPCTFRPEDRKIIAEKYVNGSSEEKIKMEKRYGKKQLTKMINDSMSEEWVNRNSKKCPHCNAAIEKSDGCNKMVCWRCKTIFCWLCNLRLNPATPYQHYNNMQSPCFNYLFHGAMGDDDEDDDDGMLGQFI